MNTQLEQPEVLEVCEEKQWSKTNTTAKITVIVLMVLGITACFFLGGEAKDVLIGITSGLVGFLSRENPKKE